jgi:hypothetical protein
MTKARVRPLSNHDRARYAALLGVDVTASVENIKKAWRKKAALHHPDKGGDPKIMTDINVAWDALKEAGPYVKGTSSQHTHSQRTASSHPPRKPSYVDPDIEKRMEALRQNLNNHRSKIAKDLTQSFMIKAVKSWIKSVENADPSSWALNLPLRTIPKKKVFHINLYCITRDFDGRKATMSYFGKLVKGINIIPVPTLNTFIGSEKVTLHGRNHIYIKTNDTVEKELTFTTDNGIKATLVFLNWEHNITFDPSNSGRHIKDRDLRNLAKQTAHRMNGTSYRISRPVLKTLRALKELQFS